MNNAEQHVAKIRKLVEAKIVIEPGHIPSIYRINEEKKAKYLESWCQEFMEFIRDHRHQDIHAVFVDKIYEEQCTGCGREWEEMTDEDGVVCCAWCGKPIEIVT